MEKRRCDKSSNRAEQVRMFLFQWLLCFLGGITFGAWLRLLRRAKFAVDPVYWPRAALLTLGSFANSLHRWREQRLYGAEVAAQKIRPPLFILGHWRTGTTHLHNLLALDPQFAFPNNYQVCYPHTFLTTEAMGSRFGFLFPRRRPQDNVRLGLAEAQEDEFALAVATSLSPYLGWVFPRQAEFYERYLTFRAVPQEEVTKWQAGFFTFLQKLTLKYGRPLVLKSPTHTCRIKLLLEMFPDARFVHIHRNPFTVFQSTRRLFDSAIPCNALQTVQYRQRDERILRTGRLMYDIFFEERSLIPPGRYHEIGFEDLERDPVNELCNLYRSLALGGFEEIEPAIRSYLAALGEYRKNEYPDLSREIRERIAAAWGRYFAEWGYGPG
jgi:omega-hydroxy-beta-dihydromenaquinone-9 sulfotransferase